LKFICGSHLTIIFYAAFFSAICSSCSASIVAKTSGIDANPFTRLNPNQQERIAMMKKTTTPTHREN